MSMKTENFKNFIFDIDGTLMQENGDINPYVYDLFRNILSQKNNPQIIFNTSASIPRIKHLISNIKKEVGDFKPIISTFAGSLIFNKEDFPIYSQTIEYDMIKFIEKTAKSIDKNSILFCRTRDENLFVKPKFLSKKKAIVAFLRLNQLFKSKKAETARSITEEEFENYMKGNNFYEVEVLSLNKNKNKEITKKLTTELALNFPYGSVSGGKLIHISGSSKLDAVNLLLNAEGIEKSVYFGDSYNDIDCLETIPTSFAVGENVKALKAGTYAYKDLSLANKLLYGELNPATANLKSKEYIRSVENKLLSKNKTSKLTKIKQYLYQHLPLNSEKEKVA